MAPLVGHYVSLVTALADCLPMGQGPGSIDILQQVTLHTCTVHYWLFRNSPPVSFSPPGLKRTCPFICISLREFPVWAVCLFHCHGINVHCHLSLFSYQFSSTGVCGDPAKRGKLGLDVTSSWERGADVRTDHSACSGRPWEFMMKLYSRHVLISSHILVEAS